MAPPNISSEQLRSFRLRDELRVTQGEGDGGQLDTRRGNWLGRAIRSITGFLGWSERTERFTEAKKSVLEALKKEYGEEIGQKVFRSNIGHMMGETHVSSVYHPITGRHIQKMLEQGDLEILEKYAKPEHGGAVYGKQWSTPQGGPIPGVPEPATRDWMLRKSVGLDGPTQDDPPNLDPLKRFDRRDVNLHVSEVEIRGNVGQTYYEKVAQSLFDDYETRLEGHDGRGLSWTFDLKLDEGAPLHSTHTIGVRIDPEEPGIVNVFDVNHYEVKIPREEFGAWLRAHINHNYDGTDLHIYRAEETMKDSQFTKVDGKWKAQFELEVDPRQLELSLKKNMEKQTPATLRETSVSSSFRNDLDRMSIEIHSPNRPYGLTVDNFLEGMRDLVGDGTTQEEQNALLNLSILLSQNLGNTLFDPVTRGITEQMDVEMMTPGGSNLRVVVTKSEDVDPVIGIQVEVLRGCHAIGGAMVENSTDLLAPGSHTHTSYRLEVPLSSLGQPEGWRDVRVVGEVPTRVDLEAFVGVAPEEVPQPHGISLYSEENRLVSDSTISREDVNTLFGSCGLNKDMTTVENLTLNKEFVETFESEGLGHIRLGYPGGDHDAFQSIGDMTTHLHGLNQQGRLNLSHLLAPSTAMDLYRSMMRKALRDEEFDVEQDNHPDWRATITPSNDGQTLDIEYRLEIPKDMLENAPGVALYYGSPRQEPGHFETIVKIRVPVEQLNERIPESYDLMHPGRLEWRPENNN
jgi:hypothetical protein